MIAEFTMKRERREKSIEDQRAAKGGTRSSVLSLQYKEVLCLL